jgi:hypothetical protein
MLAKMFQGLMNVFSFSISLKVDVPRSIQLLLHCGWREGNGPAVAGLVGFGKKE